MVVNRTNDGSAPPQFHTPPNSDPYEWQITAGCPPAGGVFKHWSNVKPFGIESASQFRADAPPKLTSMHMHVTITKCRPLARSTAPCDRRIARMSPGFTPHNQFITDGT